MENVREMPCIMRPDVNNPVGFRNKEVVVVKETEPRIGRVNKSTIKFRRVLLKCDCGKEFERDLHDVLNGRVKRCHSCANRLKWEDKIPDEAIVGKKYGMLTVIRVERKINKNGQLICWAECECDCGNTKTVNKYDLIRGHIVSCGHYRKDRARETIVKVQKALIEAREKANKEERSQAIGKKFNGITILEEVGSNGENATRLRNVKVQCDCGCVFNAKYDSVATGIIKMCAKCASENKRSELISKIIGKKFNKLTVLAEAEPAVYHYESTPNIVIKRVKVQCDCGKVFEARYNRVISGFTRMCASCALKEYYRKSKENMER